MAVTKDDLWAQLYVAFGRGVGGAFVESAALAALRAQWEPKMTADLLNAWETPGVGSMILEKFQLMGRHAAHLATMDGRVAVGTGDYGQAVAAVLRNPTPWC